MPWKCTEQNKNTVPGSLACTGRDEPIARLARSPPANIRLRKWIAAADIEALNESGSIDSSSAFFEQNVTKIAVQWGVFLRNYAYRFMQMLAPHLDLADLAGAGNRPQARSSEEA